MEDNLEKHHSYYRGCVALLIFGSLVTGAVSFLFIILYINTFGWVFILTVAVILPIFFLLAIRTKNKPYSEEVYRANWKITKKQFIGIFILTWGPINLFIAMWPLWCLILNVVLVLCGSIIIGQRERIINAKRRVILAVILSMIIGFAPVWARVVRIEAQVYHKTDYYINAPNSELVINAVENFNASSAGNWSTGEFDYSSDYIQDLKEDIDNFVLMSYMFFYWYEEYLNYKMWLDEYFGGIQMRYSVDNVSLLVNGLSIFDYDIISTWRSEYYFINSSTCIEPNNITQTYNMTKCTFVQRDISYTQSSGPLAGRGNDWEHWFLLDENLSIIMVLAPQSGWWIS
ncbi:MAG: hypothetical protein ACFFCS_02650 [Candidatus Hodarchaeota archaeon]